MRIKNRIISFVLTAAMLLSLLPATVLAGEYQESDFVATVYVDGVNGANTATNDGSTPEKAAATSPSATPS